MEILLHLGIFLIIASLVNIVAYNILFKQSGLKIEECSYGFFIVNIMSVIQLLIGIRIIMVISLLSKIVLI